MTAKEYLSQAYRLAQRIASNIAAISRLRELACGISSVLGGEGADLSQHGCALRAVPGKDHGC